MDNADLEKLQISLGKLVPKFKTSATEYSVVLGSDVKELKNLALAMKGCLSKDTPMYPCTISPGKLVPKFKASVTEYSLVLDRGRKGEEGRERRGREGEEGMGRRGQERGVKELKTLALAMKGCLSKDTPMYPCTYCVIII